MTIRKGPIFGAAATAALALLLQGGAAVEVQRDQLQRYRNLGKAFYENPTTQTLAVDEFKKALDMAPDSVRERINYGLALLRAAKTEQGTAELEKAQKQDPSIPHTWFNLGIVYKKESQYEKAIPQLEGMLKLVPSEPVTHYNLGVLYKLAGKQEVALQHFEAASKLNPNLAGPHFQMMNAYRTLGRAAEATREQQIFQDIKKRTAGAAIPEDLEWSFYAEIYETIDPALSKDDQPGPAVKFTPARLATGLDAATAGALAADVDGDGKPDLIVWSAKGVQVFKSGAGAAVECGLGSLKDVVTVAAGDFNNDGLADLAIVTKTGAALYTNQKGKYEASAAKLPAGPFTKAVWMDYDHDYDLDLFLLGETSALMRNNGAAGFSDESAAFPFVKGQVLDAALFDLVPDTDGFDLVVTFANRPGVLYRDKLATKYEPVDLPQIAAGTASVAAFDINNDGATDLITSSALVINQNGKLDPPKPLAGSKALALLDVENRGLADIASGGTILRNQGLGAFADAKVASLANAAIAASADFDGDGHADLAVVHQDGSLDLLRNQTETKNTWIRASLLGVKNLKLSNGAKVELKAGARYAKQTYRGLPLHFGLGTATAIDTVRITWANGMVQNELKQVGGKPATFKEAPRLSGSCPMIFTWNGKKFEYITDVLGVAPLGASSGDGQYFPLDHDEYIQIPGSALKPVNGRYQVRITEELREVSYLDQIQLIAVDHPAATEIYTNDKFKSPPFPEFRLFGVDRRIYPTAARDQRGASVLSQLRQRDQQYPDTFRRDYNGSAELHHLDLDFGNAAASNRAVLILNGWVDWADGSTFLAASQEKKGGLVMPYLQVKDAAGQWRTVIEDMGIPAGKPKTISVDLTGKFLSASREVRIVTNLCVYWDEIFLSEQTAAPRTVLTALTPGTADLRFRGFSRPVIHPERKQPERFVYDDVQPVSQWNPTPGLYTRFGDVKPLLGTIDDRMVIMGSGDELELRFDARGLPPLPQGWSRDFLLMVDGWAKDADANTAYSKTVEPLPFHGMSAYPYTSREAYPDDAAHRQYQKEYNARPALRLLRPLTD
jgi:tetratricopeptide (TPR) repeat protein